MANDNALKVEMLVMYKECMHNHAASSGGFLLDGCGLFESPSGTTTGSREAMFCAVCGCHRNFHQRVAVEIPQHYGSSSASHPHQQQQPVSHQHQQQQPASHHHHHHNHRGGRGTMIIRREPASAPGRFAPEQAAPCRQRPAASPALTTSPATRRVQSRAPHRHAAGTSARQGVPPQHGVRATCAKRITRAQTEMVRALTERNNWKRFREYSQAEVLRICSDFGITTLALKNCISSLHRRRRKAAIAAIDQR